MTSSPAWTLSTEPPSLSTATTVSPSGFAALPALVFHGSVKAVSVDGQVTLARDVLGEIKRETIGVVQTERIHARNDAIADLGCNVVEDFHAGVQRFGETLFFGLQGTHYGIGLCRQLRIGF